MEQIPIVVSVREGAAVERRSAIAASGRAVTRLAGLVVEAVTGGGRVGATGKRIPRRVGLLRKRRREAKADSGGDEQPSVNVHRRAAYHGARRLRRCFSGGD